MKRKATKLQTLIKNNNAKYRKATKAQRRVMIAKDALKQIEAGSITPESGTYIHLHDHTIRIDTPLQPVLLKGDTSCACCAKGALFISCVRLSNKYNGNPTGIGSGSINETVKWPEENYHLIEEAFETSPGDWWFDRYPEDADRLKEILKNIIRNKGTFKTEHIALV